MNRDKKIISELIEIVGKRNVLTEKDDLLCYARDRYPPLVFPKDFPIPMAVVRPISTAEIQKIVVIANKYRIPIVPRGGGTSFSGSATSISGGITLDTTRMKKIININMDDMWVKVQAGVVIQDLEEKLNEKGSTVGHDPGSFPSATVGGCIATNALGWRAGKYGDMGRLVLGLQVVLPTASVIETRSMPKSSTGFNVNNLLIGSEGTLGIITQATLQIKPLPEEMAIVFYAFNEFETAQQSLIKVLKTGLSPATMLVMDENGVKEFISESEKQAPKAGLILSYEGLKEEVEAEVTRTIPVLEKNGGVDLGEKAAKNFWLSRHDMYSTMNLEGTYDNIDTAVPINSSIDFYNYLKNWAKKHKIKSLGISSWMLPQNVSIDFVFNEKFPQEVKKYMKARDEAARKALELGGTLSYCIGIGVRYSHIIHEEHGPVLEVMRAIKKTLDPNNIMNPGRMGL